MNLTVKRATRLKGSVRLPASKSYSIRAFMVAACGGSSTIVDPSNSEDAMVAAKTARALGSDIEHKATRWRVKAKQRRRTAAAVHVGESGTVLRFILPLLALDGKRAKVTGQGTLRGRPNKHLTRTLRAMGVKIKGAGPKESVPVSITGGTMKGGRVTVDGRLSSQFISALLIACPQLKDDTRLSLKGHKLVSTDYITMTEQILKLSGVRIVRRNKRNYQIRGKQEFKGLKNFHVPSDYGLAAFLLAAAVLSRSNVKLNGYFQGRFAQADERILPLMRRMGAKIKKSSKGLEVRGPQPLKGRTFSLKDCPDLVPVMTVLAMFAKGTTKLKDIAHARAKESDRISDLRKELLKVGAKIKEEPNALTVYPQETYKTGRALDPHNDHRLAMAFCVLGSKIGVIVNDIQCIAKSYPDFVKDLRTIGVPVRTR